MRTALFIILAILACSSGFTQNSPEHDLYDPEADAREQIRLAVVSAKENNKHVMVQVGGNWCPWCLKLHEYLQSHHSLDSILHSDYEVVRINYSKENKNLETLAELGFPQRFGFPVLVILDSDGRRIHTQNTVFLEENNSYSESRIVEFLLNWNRSAIDPENYQ